MDFGLWTLVLCLGFLLGCGQSRDPTASRAPDRPPPGAETTAPRQLAPLLSREGSATQPKSRLPVYELRMEPRALAEFEQTSYSNDTHPATFLANGVLHDNVKVRFRGQWARTWPKKPIKIFFNHDKPFEGRRCLNLNSGWRDPAFVRETLAYRIYAACGVPSPEARMVRLQINGEFRGLYVEVEQPDKAFLNRLDLKGASLFKAISRSNQADERDHGPVEAYHLHYDRETQKAEGFGDLQSFCHELASATNVLDFFNERVDLDSYINYLAATVLVQHWDCFNKNHFLVYDGQGSKKWFVVPWDLDRTCGDHWRGSFDVAQLPILLGTRQSPGTTGWNRLEDQFLSEPTLRARFLKRLGELVKTEFTTEKLFPILDRLESDIAAEAALDRDRWPSPTPDLHTGIAQLKSYIQHRRSYLLSHM